MLFSEMNLSDEVVRSVEHSGFTIPTEVQEKCIPAIMSGLDVVGRSKTGSGKTLAFGIPLIEHVNPELKAVQSLVICPTRELAMQVAEEMRKATEFKEGCKMTAVFGGADMGKQIDALKRAKIVVATPGRLMDHIGRRTIKLDFVKTVVLDEADEMLNMGFREDIEKILRFIPRERQTVMFSATMPPAIRRLTEDYMVTPTFVEIGDLNTTIDTIEQSYLKVPKDAKKTTLVNLFKTCQPQSAIVFCNTKRMADEIRRTLNNNGVGAEALHGDMPQSARRRVMDAMKAHKINILVATDVAARGIDIDDIDYVINYDLPNDVEYYIHRIGRTGRAGKAGKAVTFITDRRELAILNIYKNNTHSDIAEHKLSEDSIDFAPPKPSTYYKSMKRPGSLNPGGFRRRR
ncbi:MAG: DEAD/DEAH box helicase [Clostridiaceae bacterium]|jgi:ATP-dependent RNA helicase DeaD|nr:DEAD/DEAH box helicase [Clostridiaceae bacterium]